MTKGGEGRSAVPFSSLSLFYAQKQKPLQKKGFFLAQRKGFEPLIRFRRIHDFQSCALDQLSHLCNVSQI